MRQRFQLETDSSHIVFTSIIRLGGVDAVCFKTKLRIFVYINTPPAAKLLSWQQQQECHFVSFVMDIFDAKFQEHCFNISRDIVYYDRISYILYSSFQLEIYCDDHFTPHGSYELN